MGTKKIYLSNGDVLTKTSDGNYEVSYDGQRAPKTVSREEAEDLLFETANQLKMSLEVWIENSREWQGVAEHYGSALEEIAEFEHGDLEQTEIARKALEEDEEE